MLFKKLLFFHTYIFHKIYFSLYFTKNIFDEYEYEYTFDEEHASNIN